jgi:death on curing protein
MPSWSGSPRRLNTLAAEPRWLTVDDVIRIHERQIASTGGVAGIKDEGLVESAVGNPRHLWSYEEVDDLVLLAVRTAMAVARNHGFNDGNKRTAATAMGAFLYINGYEVVLEDDLTLGLWIEQCLVENVSEYDFAEFLASHIGELPEGA